MNVNNDSIVKKTFALLHRIDWRRRDVKDAVVITVLTIFAFAISITLDLYDYVNAFVLEHEDLKLDELLMMSSIISIALIIYGYRRFNDLSREMAARKKAEIETQAERAKSSETIPHMERTHPLAGLP